MFKSLSQANIVKRTQQQNRCDSKLINNQKQLIFCQKSQFLSSLTLSNQIQYSSGIPLHHSVYTESVQSVQLNFTFKTQPLPSFAVFGLTTELNIQNSAVRIFFTNQLAEGALICLQCDLITISSEFIFSAFGNNISGLVLQSIKILELTQVKVQVRLSGEYLSGLLGQASQIQITIYNVNLTGYFTGENIKGALIAVILIHTQIQATNLYVCTNSQNFGVGEIMVQLNGNIVENCNKCEESFYAYGFCLNTMDNGILQNEILICAETFIFDGQECACPKGTVLNDTICVNILESMSKIIVTLEDYKLKVEQSIISNMTQVTENLIQLKQDIDSRIISNIATLDAKIQNTLDSLNTSIQSINSSLKQQTDTNDQINETVQLLKQEILVLVAQINCESKQGYSYVDNLCVQVPCDIAGQLNINGICQCIGMFQIVKNSLCVCPDNSVFSNGVCTCTILGQVMRNGVCKCHTTGAFVLNSVCSCGENSVNTSNICGCPLNSVLIDSACICTSIQGQIMKDLTCQCQLNQILVNNVCTYKINNDDILMVCTAQLLIATFNINAITNSVTSSSDFGAGYVFSQTVVFQNIFIDVQNNVYSTTIKPLFQNQIQFTNIKIQLGTQVMGNGAVLSSLSSIRVNNMNIISKSGCTITVQTNYQLNLLIGASKDNNIINNLLINLSMLMSSGNLTLIGNINSILIVQNYSTWQLLKLITNVSRNTSNQYKHSHDYKRNICTIKFSSRKLLIIFYEFCQRKHCSYGQYLSHIRILWQQINQQQYILNVQQLILIRWFYEQRSKQYVQVGKMYLRCILNVQYTICEKHGSSHRILYDCQQLNFNLEYVFLIINKRYHIIFRVLRFIWLKSRECFFTIIKYSIYYINIVTLQPYINCWFKLLRDNWVIRRLCYVF
ncbi:Conserved_hypothetical protein [Hexamita inflata]|uniref:Uncharacterized protein n=1 Tax=Hexamita inflata TaxID=28002 RepID=A0AA86Q1M1_9EUKA|nr:Conserved hypothetical protein [Hexamita inflata]